MSFSRVGVLGHALLPRGSPAPVVRSVIRYSRVRTIVPQRQFTAINGRLQQSAHEGISQAPSSTPALNISEAQRLKNAQSIVILHVPKTMGGPKLKAVLKDCGIEMNELSVVFDRFTFNNTRTAFVELASEQQAQDALKKYNLRKPLGKTVAQRMRPNTKFGESFTEPENRLFEANESGIAKAIQPIIDQRRCVFAVVPPAWADLKAPVKVRNNYNRAVVERVLNPFGIEAISRLVVNWGDKKQTPRFLCFVDFKKKQGAEEAIRAIHDTEIDKLKVWLEATQVRPWTAYKIGKLDKKTLELLQAKGLAPPPEEIDEERYSMRLEDV